MNDTIAASPRRDRRPGLVLNSRCKGNVTWQARISTDRGRLQVVACVPPSATTTEVEPLTEHELLELLGEHDDTEREA